MDKFVLKSSPGVTGSEKTFIMAKCHPRGIVRFLVYLHSKNGDI